VDDFGARGIRSLAIGRTLADDEKYVFAGLLTFLDPPRPDTKSTIHHAFAYGIDVKMITGDQLLIARETARQLSMGDNISLAHGLPDFQVGSDIPKDLGKKFGQMCYDSDGFAQVCDVLPLDVPVAVGHALRRCASPLRKSVMC
jgi:H+-transporting ATPase